MVIAYVYKLAAADGGLAQVTASAATIRRAFVAGEISALLVELDVRGGALGATRGGGQLI